MDNKNISKFEITCKKNSYNGNGIIKYNNKEYEIPGIVKGDVGLFSSDKTNLKCPIKLERIVSYSTDRINSLCPYFKECGGCQFQHISYEAELEVKREYLEDLFKSFSDIKIPKINSIPNPYYYRNKCQMTYKMSKSKNVVCGFYEEGTHKIIPVVDCKIQAQKATEIINEFNKILTKNHIEPYDEKTRKGVIKHVLVRYGFNTKEILLVIVTSCEQFPGGRNVVNDLVKKNLGITTIVQNINPRQTSIVLGNKERVLYGPGFIYETIGKLKFKISSRSFYQVNTVGMNMLYKKALEVANIKNTDIVLDTYCGVGTIGLIAASKAKQVYGVELNRDAYNDAIINAKLNGVKNIKFFNDDSTKFLKTLDKNTHIDVLIMDPPRDGTTKEFIDAIGELKIKKIVYVSCEPKTLVRDLYQMSRLGYNVKSIEGFDMFARTSNIECVATLSLRK